MTKDHSDSGLIAALYRVYAINMAENITNIDMTVKMGTSYDDFVDPYQQTFSEKDDVLDDAMTMRG